MQVADESGVGWGLVCVGLAGPSKDFAIFFVRWEPQEDFEQKRDGMG